jgi:hypothetical protein
MGLWALCKLASSAIYMLQLRQAHTVAFPFAEHCFTDHYHARVAPARAMTLELFDRSVHRWDPGIR